MALIKCPECGKEISDKAPACIHCGYPLDLIDEKRDEANPDMVVINAKQYDLTPVFELIEKKKTPKAIIMLDKMTGIGLTDAKTIVNNIAEQGRETGMKFSTNIKNDNSGVKVECPYCHSKNTYKISNFTRAAALTILGIRAMNEVSKQWHCNDCGSDF